MPERKRDFMQSFQPILTALRTIVIFRNVKNGPAVQKLLRLLTLCESADAGDAKLDAYADFAAALYENNADNLTVFLRELVLSDENLYVRAVAQGLAPGVLLEECLAVELKTLGALSQVACHDFPQRLEYDGFLPGWQIEPMDLTALYHARLAEIPKRGYGIFAAHHVFVYEHGTLTPVKKPDPVKPANLSGYERERGEVLANARALLSGQPANNVLLYGDCGTGKSATVKAVANALARDGLRLIELKKKQLHLLPDVVAAIADNPLKFILFIDDLSFAEDDDDFAALKAMLEGSVSTAAPNAAVFATSNRRHLVRESFSAREGDDIHRQDTMQELLSLSDRFGVTVTFSKPSRAVYFDIVTALAKQAGLTLSPEELALKAEQFALRRGGRSPRAAKQLIELLQGQAASGKERH
ncbi:MAG: ATP-binding protein [Oscillospiraceae bacterium]